MDFRRQQPHRVDFLKSIHYSKRNMNTYYDESEKFNHGEPRRIEREIWDCSRR
jgi:hypothetical protein